MSRNLGNFDRAARMVIGILALAYAVFAGLETGSLLQIAAFAIGIIMIATSTMKFCPLYRIFGISTCSIE